VAPTVIACAAAVMVDAINTQAARLAKTL